LTSAIICNKNEREWDLMFFLKVWFWFKVLKIRENFYETICGNFDYEILAKIDFEEKTFGVKLIIYASCVKLIIINNAWH